MLDDPKHIATAPLHLAFQLLFMPLFVAIPWLAGWATWNWRKTISDWQYTLRIGLFAAGLLALWLSSHYDPGRIWNWFLD